MSQTLSVTEALAKIDRLLHAVARRFANRQITAEDLYSEASVAFVLAYPQYDEGRAMLTTFAVMVARNTILTVLRREQKRHQREASLDAVLGAEETRKRLRGVAQMDSDVTLDEEDRAVLAMALDPSAEIVESATTSRGVQSQSIRRALREHLLDLGWDAQEVRESFDRIKEYLCS